jgi:cellulose synthase/poly-beta-1,6-N-acetylglucosamine synthase-like glycosyltransferase
VYVSGHQLALGGLLLYVLDIALVLGVVLVPLLRAPSDDHGDGVGRVLIPAPRRTAPFVRFGGVLACFAALSVLYAAVLLGPVNRLYGQLVGGLAAIVVHDPGAVGGMVHNASLGTRFLYVALFICLAVTVQGTVGRRLLIAANALWYLAATMCVDAGLVFVGVLAGAGITPFGLLGNLLANLLGVIVFFRFVLTSLHVPRPTTIPIRGRRLGENGVMLLVLLGVVALVLLLVMVFRSNVYNQGLVPLVLSIYLPGAAGLFIYLGLAVVLAQRNPAPMGSASRPPIDVITPAYNEERLLPRHIRAIDEAARRYGGRVHIVICDDGSHDSTRPIAQAAISALTAATGEVLTIPHAGKSAALNAALARGTNELVIRVDADVEVGVDAFAFTYRWFEDPLVGMVGALNLPATGRSWFHRMRELECLWGFGFGRRTLQAVDGIGCVPGTYVAFRRDVARQVGGIVDGMNGEDADLTMTFGRLGYRIVLDPMVRVYEDVPPTLLEFREQRLRWNRALIHVFARHAFFHAGLAGPRTWFTLTRVQAWRAQAFTHLLLAVYILTLALLVPAYRSALLLALMVPVVTQALIIALLVGLCFYYGRFRPLPFILSWWAFFLLRHVFMIEAMFTLPSRDPHPLRALRPQPQAVTQAAR